MKILIVAVVFALLNAPSIQFQPTVYDVVSEIKSEYPSWTEEYKLSEFDCSEMSAYVSYRLDEVGIENEIVIGRKHGDYHAWVKTESNTIKCITLDVYDQNHFGGWRITSVVGSKTEWDWWNSPIFENQKGDI